MRHIEERGNERERHCKQETRTSCPVKEGHSKQETRNSCPVKEGLIERETLKTRNKDQLSSERVTDRERDTLNKKQGPVVQ